MEGNTFEDEEHEYESVEFERERSGVNGRMGAVGGSGRLQHVSQILVSVKTKLGVKEYQSWQQRFGLWLGRARTSLSTRQDRTRPSQTCAQLSTGNDLTSASAPVAMPRVRRKLKPKVQMEGGDPVYENQSLPSSQAMVRAASREASACPSRSSHFSVCSLPARQPPYLGWRALASSSGPAHQLAGPAFRLATSSLLPTTHQVSTHPSK